MTIVARFFSWLFLPLLTPLYALAIVMFTRSSERDFLEPNSLYILRDEHKWGIIYIFALFSFIVPALTVLFLRIQGRVDTIMLNDRKERYIPAIVTSLSGIALLYMLITYVPNQINGFRFLLGLALGSFTTVICCTIMTFRFKISLHAAGMGILAGFLVAYDAHMFEFNIVYVALVFFFSGVVMSMRMVLGAHNLAQCLLGFLTGFSLTFACVILSMMNAI